MKLYYSSGSCSMSCHITLEESGLPYEAVQVDFDKPADAALVEKMNALGTLPVLLTEEGKQLDQNLAIHHYVALKAPAKNLMPAPGTPTYFEAMNLLTFVATDLHKSVGALFGLAAYENEKPVQAAVRKNLLVRANDTLKYLDTKLQGKDMSWARNSPRSTPTRSPSRAGRSTSISRSRRIRTSRSTSVASPPVRRSRKS